MKKKLGILFFLLYFLQQARSQNWAPVPCYNGSALITWRGLFVDSLHNELIINSINGYTVCNTTYKGLVSFNGTQFRDLDFGLDKYDSNPSTEEIKP